jgi:hypothetical protein
MRTTFIKTGKAHPIHDILANLKAARRVANKASWMHAAAHKGVADQLAGTEDFVKARYAYYYVKLQGCSRRQAAKILGISDSTVREWLTLADLYESVILFQEDKQEVVQKEVTLVRRADADNMAVNRTERIKLDL